MSAELGHSLLGVTSLAANFVTLCIIMPHRYSLKVTVSVFAAYTSAIYLLYYLLGFMTDDLGGYRGLFYFIAFVWLFKNPFPQKLFCHFLVMSITSFEIAVAAFAAEYFAPVSSVAYLMIIVALTVIMYFCQIAALLRWGRGIARRLFVETSAKEELLYSFGVVFTFCTMAYVNTTFFGLQRLFLMMFALWGVFILCFAIINTQEKTRHKSEADFAASIISNASGHYRQIDALHSQIHILRHDMKYSLMVFDKLLQEDNRAELERYLGEVTQRLAQTEPRAYCANNVINVLLSSYAERCEEQNIAFDAAVYLPEELPVPNYELCIVIGNLLENAVEACQKLPSGRRAELIIKPLGEQLVIKAANTYGDGEGEGAKSGAPPASTKKHGGLGLRSVRAVAEKYWGELMIDRDGVVFTAYVTLDMRPNSPPWRDAAPKGAAGWSGPKRLAKKL